MGKQIEFAQSIEDEKLLVTMLLRQHELLHLPRTFQTTKPRPSSLNQLADEKVIIFGAEFIEMVLQSVVPVSGQTGLFQIFPRDNLCIEWNRSTKSKEGNIFTGRFFLPDKESKNASCKRFIHKVMANIKRSVTANSPKMSVLAPHVYLGVKLLEQIENKSSPGAAYKNGSLMELCPNPLYVIKL